ncbi:MAG: hypothetical protein Q7K26_03135 [bacterium]|nr:hypothetical protein [bacterium]
MKKYFPHISTFLLTFVLVFAMSGFLFPGTVEGFTPELARVLGVGEVIQKVLDFGTEALLAPLSWVSILILQLATLLTGLAGMILNYAVQFTIVEMAKNLKGIGTIDIAWKAIRDVANMGFIFVLLYAAIRTILGIGSDTKKLIVNIVVVAILINFSLFFTKVVIDSSNVLSTFFYDAMAPGSLTESAPNTGLSNKLMQPLKLTSLWNNKDIQVLKSKKVITIGVMGTIVSLIAAFVFFAVAIMLVIRFVVLIFVMILSPLAFIGYILPQLKEYKDQWIQALLGQAFFAPIYFMLTWIVLIISTGILESPAGKLMESSTMATAFGGAVGADGNALPPPLSSIAIMLNFIIMIVFLIASLIIAKKWADKAGHGVPGLTKWATGLAGGATLGMAGRLGRGTVGRAGAALGDSEALKERAAKGGVGGMAARLALATGRKTGSASFDVRGTPLSSTLGAGQAQKGGFIELKKKQAEREETFAASLAPSAETEAKIKDEYKKASGAYENAKKAWGNESEEAQKAKKYMDEVKQRKDRLLGDKEEVDEEIKNREQEKQRKIEDAKQSEELKAAETEEKSAYDTVSRLDAEAKSAVGEVRETKIMELGAAKTKLEELKKEAGEVRKRVQSQIRRTTDIYDKQKEVLTKSTIKPAGEIRKGKFADAVEKSTWANFRGYNYDAAAKIRKGKKSAKELIDEALKETGEKSAETKETKPETPKETGPDKNTPEI